MLTAALSLVLVREAAVTLTFPGARVPVVLAAISSATGRKLAADLVLAKEVVAVRVEEAPADVVLDHLAEAVGGEWRTLDGVATLVRSAEALNKDAATRRARRLKAISKAIASQTTADDGPLTEEAVRKASQAALEALQKAKPGQEGGAIAPPPVPPPEEALLTKLVRTLPATEYVDAHEGVRLVFSNAPNALQRALPASLSGAIETYRHDQELIERYFSPLFAKLKARLVDADEDLADLPDNLPKLPADVKVDLAIEFDASSNEGSPKYSLEIVDQLGHVFVSAGNDAAMPAGAGDDESANPSPATNESPLIRPTEEETEFGRVVFDTNILTAPGKVALLEKWHARLLDPAKYDPLSPLAGPLVRAAAARGLNFIADLQDLPIYELRNLRPKPFPALKLEERVANWRCVTLRSPGWVIARPFNFADGRENRLDREAARRLFERTIASDGTTLDDAAAYALSSPSSALLISWDASYLISVMFRDGRRGGLAGYGTDQADDLRFYGSLGPDLVAVLRAGHLTVGDLPPTALAIANHGFYDDDDLAQASKPPYEPTDVLPNGLPTRAPIRIQSEGTDLLVVPIARMDGAAVAARPPASAIKFGSLLGSARGPEFAVTKEFRVAYHHRFDILARYAPDLAGVWSLGELNYPPGPFVGFGDLPADFRAEVATAKEETRQRILEQARNRQRPPPP